MFATFVLADQLLKTHL